MKTAIYIRISKEDTKSGKSMSPEMQLEKCMLYCQMNELKDIEVYKDLDISGTKDSRPEFDRLLNDIEHKRVSAVVCYSMSRLSRSLRMFLNLMSTFGKKKVVFHAIKERIDLSSAVGRLVGNVLAALNEFEADQISERTSDNLQHRKKNLKTYCKNQPYGFKKVDGVLVVDDYEAQIVKAAFKWRKQGKGERATATRLSQEFKPRNGKRFYMASVLNIWENEKFYKEKGVI